MEIGAANAAAVAARFHVAQHCYLAHIDFRIGQGRAGIEQIGNEVDDCRFFGGEYGITTTKPSPSWPFLLIDSQVRRAARGGHRYRRGRHDPCGSASARCPR